LHGAGEPKGNGWGGWWPSRGEFRRAPYFNAAAIRASAVSTFSRELKALIRT